VAPDHCHFEKASAVESKAFPIFADRPAGSSSISKGWLFLLTDSIALASAFIVATSVSGDLSQWIRGIAPAMPTVADTIVRSGHVGILSLALLLWFASTGHYSQRLALFSEFERVSGGVAIVGLADGYLQFVYRYDISRGWVLLNWLIGLGLILTFRVVGKQALYRLGPWRCPTIVIGTERQAKQIADTLLSEHHLGYVPCETVDIKRGRGFVLGRVSDLLESGYAQHVVVSFDESEIAETMEIARVLDDDFEVPLSLVTNLRGLSIRDLRIDRVFGHDLLFLNSNRRSHSHSRMVAKRLFDIVVAGMLIVITSLAIAVIAVLVRLDGGPIFYGSARIGRGGRTFKALKFRSMVPDADRVLRDLIEREPAVREAWSRQFKLKNDPRVTWIGGYLRQLSLDELPQLFNVLRGHMSLVGPRPLLPEERARYDGAAFALYQRVMPGLTGMWQVSGRDDVEYYRRIELNSWYIKNWSPSLDLFILLKTVFTLLQKTNDR
jgi:Undecaprenyl-phosphate galactose phosphotransferase WbaP